MILYQRIIPTLILLLILVLGTNRWINLTQENNRLKQNLEASTAQTKTLRTKNGQLAQQSQVLELRVRELSVLYPQKVDEIKNLKINPKRAKQFSQVSFQSNKQIISQLTDSLVKDSSRYKIFHYRDDFFTINGIADKDSQKLDIHYQDTLIQVVYKGERNKPMWWIFSGRKLMQRVALKNPNAQIEFSQVISIQKGRRVRE